MQKHQRRFLPPGLRAEQAQAGEQQDEVSAVTSNLPAPLATWAWRGTSVSLILSRCCCTVVSSITKWEGCPGIRISSSAGVSVIWYQDELLGCVVFGVWLSWHSMSAHLFLWGRLLLLLAVLCGGVNSSIVLQKMYGRITSPKFPSTYPNHKERTWNVTVPRGYAVRIYFTHFNLELSYQCEYDYVKVCVGQVAVWPAALFKTVCVWSWPRAGPTELL